MGYCHKGDNAKLPTYRYPGTYDAAKQDTYEAAKNVGSAAMAFGSALGKSGVGKAAWSLGALSLEIGRRASKHVTTQAIIQSGYKDSLPSGVKSWVEANEEKRKLKAKTKKRLYQTADGPQSSFKQKLENSMAFIKASSTKEVEPDRVFAKDITKKSLETDSQFLADQDDQEYNIVDNNEYAGYIDPPSKTGVYGEVRSANHEDTSSYSSTVYESAMGFVENSAMTAAQLGVHVSSVIDGVRRLANC